MAVGRSERAFWRSSPWSQVLGGGQGKREREEAEQCSMHGAHNHSGGLKSHFSAPPARALSSTAGSSERASGVRRPWSPGSPGRVPRFPSGGYGVQEADTKMWGDSTGSRWVPGGQVP